MPEYDVNVEFGKNSDIDKIIANLQLNLKVATEKSTYVLHKNLLKEMPSKTGEARRNTKIIVLARNNSNDFSSEISIGPNYMWKVWKGSSSNDTVHYGHPLMVFSDWPNGPDFLRNNNGKFYFRRVNHKVRPNDFVERGMDKSVDEIANIFINEIQKAFQ